MTELERREYGAAYRAAHKAELSEYNKKYREKHRASINRSYRRRYKHDEQFRAKELERRKEYYRRNKR